ncbi:MAG TPA: polysaccharide deacetylase family protein [Streptosporangiaceae bacterium]
MPSGQIDVSGPAIGRREALGLSLFGALSTSMVVSWLLDGDSAAAPIAAPAGSRPGGADPPLAARAVRRRRPKRTEPGHEWIPAAHAPLFRVHDLMPHAPKRAVALTIDDGPDRTWTPRVLDLLAHHAVTATFCLIGVQVRKYPELVREIVEAGHDVADHTMHHPVNLHRLPTRRIDAEVGDAHHLISDVGGVAPRLFRAPGGIWSRKVLRSVARHGMVPLDWDVDPRDWSRPGTRHIARTLLRARPGDILLCHDGGGDRSETVRALHTVIPRMKDRGLEFITFLAALAAPAPVSAVEGRTGGRNHTGVGASAPAGAAPFDGRADLTA